MRSILYAAVMCCSAVIGRAQAPDSARAGWASGMSIGIPGEIGGEPYPVLFTVAANFTQIRRGPGADISVFTVPRVLPEGAVPLLVRLGVGLPIPLEPGGGAYFLPSAGVLGAGVMSANGGGATGGWYATGAFIAFGESGNGVRMAYTLYGLGEPAAWHFEIGFVHRSGR